MFLFAKIANSSDFLTADDNFFVHYLMCWQISRYLLPLSDGAVCEVRLLWRESCGQSHLLFSGLPDSLLLLFIETALVDNPEDSSGEVFNKSIGGIKMTVGMQFPDGVGCGNCCGRHRLSEEMHSVRKGNRLKNRYKYIGYAAPVRG